MHSKIKEPIITDCVVVLINQKRNTKAGLTVIRKIIYKILADDFG